MFKFRTTHQATEAAQPQLKAPPVSLVDAPPLNELKSDTTPNRVEAPVSRWHPCAGPFPTD